MVSSSQTTHKISLFSTTALSATAMVGSGWLFSAQLNAKIAGNYAFLAWLLAGILAILVGLCLSQVVAIFPVRGATSRSSALSHNPMFGMPFAFANWFGLMVTIGTEAAATTQYLAAAIKSGNLVDVHNSLTLNGKILSILILIIYLFINFFGIKMLSKVNNVITVLKIFTPIFTILLLLIGHFDSSNFNLAGGETYGISSAITAIVSAGLVYSYNGFQLCVSFASEIENPKRNVPLSIIISIIIVMAVYMLLQLAFMGAVPHQMLNNGWTSINFHSPLMELALILGLNFLASIIVADSIISPSGTGYSYLGSSSRMMFAMAKEGQIPKWSITRLHPKYNICRRSLLINFILTGLILWYSHSWSALMVVVTGYHIIGYMAAPISMGAMRPKTRVLGLIVFIILGLVMSTLPIHDLLMTNLSLLAIMLLYAFSQLSYGKDSLKTIIAMSTPVLIYLWLFYAWHNIYYLSVLSGIFYLFITNDKFVNYCKAHSKHSEHTDKEFYK